MKIDLTEIYKGLAEWRAERGITAESQKEGYIINIMEELGELATALREYERFSKPSYPYPKNKKYAEHGIIDAICDICVFTINAWDDLSCEVKPFILMPRVPRYEVNVADIFVAIADFIRTDNNRIPFNFYDFGLILHNCASVCEHYGFNFEIAMMETIKEISSRAGAYDENAKKWVKDESDEARAKWYKADYEKARIAQC